MSISGFLQQRWYEDRPPAWWTLPPAALYGGVTGLRRRLYRGGVLQARRLPVPVLVVGNLTAGGAGKTPLVIALVEALRARGCRPGIVSRGYGGMARVPMQLAVQPDPAVVGDEPALIRLRTGAPVAVGAKRYAAARLLLGDDVDVVIADDGLQHYALVRDIEVCVVDGVRRFGNGRLLPAGPLREPEARLHGVDFIVCNGGEPRAGEIPMSLSMGDAVALAGPARSQPLLAFAGRRVHAVAGIGHPPRFFDALRGLGMDVVEHPFPDHHRYTRDDFGFAGDGLPVMLTEKDAVKCGAFARPDWWSVPVSARLPDEFLDDLVGRLHARSLSHVGN
ncbi:MAG TPA: tetraacyldisaccharide 4'-kinase [Rhodanobacteraceae bacterium]|nr:tetraacyldisaccharide 4'-kinase [Rhodanobacteraceae bacterium]